MRGRAVMHLSCPLILGWLLAAGVAAAAEPARVDWSALESVAEAELRATQTPGAAVAVIQGDRVVFARGFGVADVETGRPVTPDTLFRIGSTGKMFTAAALVSLAEEGRLRLEEPVRSYVKGLHPRVGRVPLHQLLTHTAGITNAAPEYGPHDDAALGRSIRAWKADYCFTEPGDIFSYSNPGYWLAGLVLEERTGRPYADAMKERLFQPLGMSRTTFRPTMAMTYPLAQGHEGAPGAEPRIVRPAADNAETWPAGSMFSSVNDLARFVIAFMNDGRLEGKPCLPSSVITRLSTTHVPSPAGHYYGYGLNIRDFRGVRLVSHGGSRLGYGSTIRMVPEYRVAVVILGNRSQAVLTRTSEKALELLLPLAPRVSTPSVAELPLSPAEMPRYAGKYTNNRETIEIVVRDGKLMNSQGGALSRIGPDRFRLPPTGDGQPGGEIVLTTGARGRSLYLVRSGRAFKKVE